MGKLEGILMLIIIGITWVIDLLFQLVRLPIRYWVCRTIGHDDDWIGGGWIFARRHCTRCKRCGRKK